ncbi:oligoribonuclease isoform X1 [Selaginella moellendorffii]|uniref:oligoribonuclease isoform X1 n=1 Tax=Selaginella moellendorffii TaxID=88036 RepID=UPI000D1C47C2|nr:oligoribonuclease isoform X1 [Selaginella moellendorffii]|eukprot:XP_024518922.1 oligoribonuclease isoform X1 [Selaginella moellendorffii]
MTENLFSALTLIDDEDDLDQLGRGGGGSSSARIPLPLGDAGRKNGSSLATIAGEFVSRPLVWIDLEMTGLDVCKDRILEIACIITDGKLTKSIEGPNLVIHQSDEILKGMGEWCQTHHAASGLTERVQNSKVTEAHAEMLVLKFVQKYTIAGYAQLAGNSVYNDLNFLRVSESIPKLPDDLDKASIFLLRLEVHADASSASLPRNRRRELDQIAVQTLVPSRRRKSSKESKEPPSAG